MGSGYGFESQHHHVHTQGFDTVINLSFFFCLSSDAMWRMLKGGQAITSSVSLAGKSNL